MKNEKATPNFPLFAPKNKVLKKSLSMNPKIISFFLFTLFLTFLSGFWGILHFKFSIYNFFSYLCKVIYA